MTGQVVSKNGVSLNPPIPVSGGQVSLGVGRYTIGWTASDGVQTVSAIQTVVVGAGIEAGSSFLVDDRASVLNSGGGFGRS